MKDTVFLNIKNNDMNYNLISDLCVGNQFLERSFWNTAAVSSLTFNTDLWKNIDVKKYYGIQCVFCKLKFPIGTWGKIFAKVRNFNLQKTNLKY